MKGDTPQMRMKLCSEVLSYDFRTPFWSNGYCYSLFGTETLNEDTVQTIKKRER